MGDALERSFIVGMDPFKGKGEESVESFSLVPSWTI